MSEFFSRSYNGANICETGTANNVSRWTRTFIYFFSVLVFGEAMSVLSQATVIEFVGARTWK